MKPFQILERFFLKLKKQFRLTEIRGLFLKTLFLNKYI